MIGIGIDVVDIDRFRQVMERSPKLVERVLTDDERDYSYTFADPVYSLAARFAAKEAVMKALGVGLGAFEFHDVEIVREKSGAPGITVGGDAYILASQKGVSRWYVSLSHTDSVATAMVMAE